MSPNEINLLHCVCITDFKLKTELFWEWLHFASSRWVNSVRLTRRWRYRELLKLITYTRVKLSELRTKNRSLSTFVTYFNLEVNCQKYSLCILYFRLTCLQLKQWHCGPYKTSVTAEVQYINKVPFPNRNVDPGGQGGIILASGSEVRGFDPGRGRWIFFQSVKLLSMTFLGREVKPWVPCRRFTARKRTSSRN